MIRILGRYIPIISFVILVTSILHVMALPPDFVPITPENAADVRPLSSFRGNPYPVSYSSDGKFLITESRGFVNIRNLVSGEEVLRSRERILATSPDESTLLLSDRNETRLYDLETGTSEILVSASSGWGGYSPNGKWIVTSSGRDGLTRLWDATTREWIRLESYVPLGMNQTPIFSPDGSSLLMLGNQNVYLVDILTGEPRAELPAEVRSGAIFMPDGKTLITYLEQTFTMWDIATGAQLSSTEIEKEVTWEDVAISSNGQTLLVHGRLGRELMFWDISDPTQPNLGATLRYFRDFTLSPDGQTIAIFGDYENNPVHLIDVRTGEEKALLEDHHETVVQVAFSEHGRLIITSGFDEMMRFWSWDGENADLLATMPGRPFFFSPDLSTIVAWFSNGTTVIYGIPTESRLAGPLLIPGEIIPETVNVRAAPDVEAPIIGLAGGNVLVAARNEQGSYVYLPDYAGWVRADAQYFRLIPRYSFYTLPVMEAPQTVAALFTPTPTTIPPTATPTALPSPTWTPGPPALPAVNPPIVPLPPPLEGWQPITGTNLDQVRLLSVIPASLSEIGGLFSADGRFVTMRGDRSMPQFWDLAALEHDAEMDEFLFRKIIVTSPTGNLYAYNLNDDYTALNIWRVADRQEILTVPVLPESGRGGLTFSYDETRVIVSNQTRVQLWDVTTGELLMTLPRISSPAFSPDGKLLAVVPDLANVIEIYDTQTGALLNTFDPLRKFYANFMRFTPDGDVLVVGNMLWDVNSGSLIADFNNVNFRLLSPNSQFMVTLADTNRENTLYLWDTHTGGLLAAMPINIMSNSQLAFSADSKFIAISNPFQIIDLVSWTLYDIEGDYVGEILRFSPDGTNILLGDTRSTMLLGIPGRTRTEWQPIKGRIIPPTLDVYDTQWLNSSVIGTASGEVLISGYRSRAFYLPEFGGWVSSEPTDIFLGEWTIWDLPVIQLP